MRLAMRLSILYKIDLMPRQFDLGRLPSKDRSFLGSDLEAGAHTSLGISNYGSNGMFTFLDIRRGSTLG